MWGQFQPESENEYQGGGDSVDPGVLLGFDNMPQATEGILKGPNARWNKGIQWILFSYINLFQIESF